MNDSSSISRKELLSLILVGAFWGCTNPLLRRGSTEEESKDARELGSSDPFAQKLLKSLRKFRNVRVWLPYALNQCGSFLYYVLLASSDLSTAVPICNSLALVFSFLTSFITGEEVDKPVRAILGSTLVVLGVSICMMSREMDFVASMWPMRIRQDERAL